ncbi:hypothetical protein HOL21_00315 [Candidatus Woesearchaeota archaeon]|nr:hypothetical protein [Candidatus Woesearchaeota archaeon]MBT5396641.1 hypothetical protein [Candidatus Woesearchaeota archaeon]MBT5924662.1 hypothetical protein [Candidatus Woesearchaeota archaeon]MBT6367572.1 hypothetical protein [Candidatus Woesearchaeota archaeon]MBT7763071.1 hypothetical protein [Candidatus Woesearchaeota archaeon]
MGVLRIHVTCFRCHKPVDKAEARSVENLSNKPRYECFSCYKGNKPFRWRLETETRVKRKMYCERCNYKFSSHTSICPYCNKTDWITEGKISIQDLL